MQWYTRSPQEVMEELSTREHGLTGEEVKANALRYGQNKLPETKPDSVFKIFLKQFQSPIIYILLIAALIVFFMEEYIDGTIILFVLILNAVIGSVQEGRAQNTLLALRKMITTNAAVLRDHKEVILPDHEVVPGDILVLKEGDKVSADARIISSNSLKVDEAALTGESEPVTKTIDAIEKDNLQVADQRNMIFKGTNIVGGEARAVVVSTGVNTVIGAISLKLTDVDTDVPLKKNIKSLSRLIIITVLAVSAAIFVAGVFHGIGIREMFATVVAIAVSVIPEGLPVVVTVVLAAGMYRMSKRNALVKRLQAVEALGQAEVIAVDKTGTVTLNQMMVEKIYVNESFYEITGNGYNPSGDVLKNGVVIEHLEYPEILLIGKVASFTSSASTALSEETKEWQRLSGDPTEAALLTFSQKLGFDKSDLEREHTRVFEVPFSSALKYHAVAHVVGGNTSLSVAGAPEVIVENSYYIWKDGKPTSLHKEDTEAIERAIVEMSQQGLRVIALAISSDVPKEFDVEHLPKLCFVGLVGMSDSIRNEVYDALKDAHEAGVRVVMITGDHKETAKAVAKKIGIYNEEDVVLTGRELQELSAEEVVRILPKVSVFARIAPEDKLKIIEAYRKQGKIIAMTGDGVNDALSLAAADLGIGMGRIGTEVAKEASDIILLDDNFGSIVAAIEEGRNIYKTIKKVLLYLFSTSIGELFTIGGAIFLGLTLPVNASQIIWLNFVTDGFLVIALALEPKEKQFTHTHTVARQSRWMIDAVMAQRMILVGIAMMFGTLTLFTMYEPYDMAKASTIALTTLAVFQWFNAWNVRSEKRSIFSKGIFSNKFLLPATVVVILLQVAAVYTPFFQRILRTVPLTLVEWGFIVGVSLLVILVDEARKAVYRLLERRAS